MVSAVTNDLVKQLHIYCEHCGLCQSVCPVLRESDQVESAGPRGRKTLFLGLAEGDLKPSHSLAEKFYMCATCRACYEKCAAGVDIAELSIVARQDLIRAGVVPGFVKKIASSVMHGVEKGDIFGASKTKANWAIGLNLPNKGETLFFASCMDSSMGYGETLFRLLRKSKSIGLSMLSAGSLLQRVGLNQLFESVLPMRHGFYRSSLLNSVRSLQILGIDIAYMHNEEPCCGIALHTYGLIDEFSIHANKVYELLKQRGVTRLVTHNPICGAAFKKFYPRYVPKWDIEVRHVTETIAEKIVEQDLHFAYRKTRVAYHDPCFLARYMNVIQEPRIILSRIDGIELVEPDHTKLETWCDGGGGVEMLYPNLCEMIAETRVRELASTGAEKILSCCPVCAMMIRRGIDATGMKIEYADIVDLFYEAATHRKQTLGIQVH